MKPVVFHGSALDDLRLFPTEARREAGYQLDKVQNGQEPSDWKPMPVVGEGVKEIRIRDRNLPGHLFGEADGCRTCFALLPEKNSENQ
jgi:phage-related protein